MPNERGDSRFNFPNTENKRKFKFFTKDEENKEFSRNNLKVRKLNDN
jgi:hypothetical protein